MKKQFIPVVFAAVLAMLILPSGAQAIDSSYNLMQNSLTGGMAPYGIMFDYTQANNLNAVVSNTQITSTLNTFPLTGFSQPPVAAINPGLWPSSSSTSVTANDLYWEVDTGLTQVTNPLSYATNYTCQQSFPSWCPPNYQDVPQDFIHLNATISGTSPNYTQTAITNSALKPLGSETPASFFSLNDQAFNMDRLRYAANRLWYQWYNDAVGKHNMNPRNGNWATWSAKHNPDGTNNPYQLTGTMSFENFLDNAANNRPMYGIVRVIVPVDPSNGEIYADPNQPLGGNELTNNDPSTGKPYVWGSLNVSNPLAMIHTGANVATLGGSGKNTPPDLQTLIGDWNCELYKQCSSKSATITVYGSLMMDYVDMHSYNPDDFIDNNQDYVDKYSDTASHDSTINGLVGTDKAVGTVSATNPVNQGNYQDADIENAILPRSLAKTENLNYDEKLMVNPAPEGSDNEVDSVAQAQSDIINQTVAFPSSTGSAKGYDDAAVWEYWMRQAVQNSPSSSTYKNIIADLTNTSNYNYVTQSFANTSDTYYTQFPGQFTKMTPADQFHAFFPCDYEHGWIMAFDALQMDNLDGTNTPGTWWSNLTQASSSDATGGVTIGSLSQVTFVAPPGAQGTSPDGLPAYDAFGIPGSTQDITLDANGDGITTSMPNFFSSSWEDLPAFYYAGGYLNLQSSMNIGGMVYTPDSAYIAPGAGTTGASAGFMEYISGALLAGNGIYMQASNSSNQLLAISFNYNAFDRLDHGPMLTSQTLTNISELQGQ